MKFHPHNLYHVYNQGNNRQRIFSCDEDYFSFLKMVRLCLKPHAEIIAYCLMPNHFHFFVFTDERVMSIIKLGDIFIDPVTNGLRKLLSGYARIYNSKYNRTGSLFRQKTKSKCLSEMTISATGSVSNADYYTNCFNYIHQNPLKAGLVNNLEEWEFSSFKDYAGLREGTLCNKSLAEKYCGYIPDYFFNSSHQMVEENISKLLF